MSPSPSKNPSPSPLFPAQPIYILRGHSSSINALHFTSQNTRLLTGDADGFVVLWDLTVKRPLVVWRAHAGSLLGIGVWREGVGGGGNEGGMRGEREGGKQGVGRVITYVLMFSFSFPLPFLCFSRSLNAGVGMIALVHRVLDLDERSKRNHETL